MDRIRVFRLLRFLPLFLLPALAGCISQLSKLDSVGPNDTVMVLGVEPSNVSLTLFQGRVKNGYFQGYATGTGYANNPQAGYMITKVTPGDVLGLTEASVKDRRFSSRRVKLCNFDKSMVFEAPKGKIIYIADVSVTESESYEGKYDFKYMDRFNQAKAYLDREYPALRDRLVKWPYWILPMAVSCDSPGLLITLPKSVGGGGFEFPGDGGHPKRVSDPWKQE